jgi:hypothetical protein
VLEVWRTEGKVELRIPEELRGVQETTQWREPTLASGQNRPGGNMKKQLIAAVTTLSIAITLSVAALAGLSSKLNVTIPFEFMVNGKTLPAGKYIVTPSSTKDVVILTSRENRITIKAFVMGIQSEKKTPASLAFRRYGQQHFLARISDGTDAGFALPTSNAERAAAKGKTDYLSQKMAPEIITLPVQAGQ